MFVTLTVTAITELLASWVGVAVIDATEAEADVRIWTLFEVMLLEENVAFPPLVPADVE